MEMAAEGFRVTVDDGTAEGGVGDPKLIASAGCYLRVKNSGANPVDLGGATVASGAGYAIAANEVIEVDCAIDELYGICAAGQTSTLEVLAVRRPYR